MVWIRYTPILRGGASEELKALVKEHRDELARLAKAMRLEFPPQPGVGHLHFFRTDIKSAGGERIKELKEKTQAIVEPLEGIDW